jgi:hypothetical protein
MSAGTSLALGIIRVARGAQKPAPEQLRAAVDQDRRALHMPPGDGRSDLMVAGPYALTINGEDIDEYVVWER